jgi:hypothetical protein
MISNLPVTMKLGKNVSMALLRAQKNSPALLFGTGVVGVVGTVVLASRATLKLSDIVEDTSTKLEKVKTLEDPTYSEQDRARDKAIVYTKASIDISKLYLPAVAIGIVSIGCLTGSHIVLNRRNVALSAAYAGAEKALREYRERVVTEVGPEIERKIWQPTEKVDAIDENGKKVKIDVPTAAGGSPYKVLFDESNKNWNRDVGYNQVFISSQNMYANDLLRAKGVVFLNDVHDMLGLERTKAGQIVGWVWNGEGDNYIDFGVYRDGYDGIRFVNGEERSVWLDFNVDGNVLDILDN